jgi:uncharacterized membrane protein
MVSRFGAVAERLRSSLFLVPMAAVVVAVGGGLATVTVDRGLADGGTDLPFVLASTVDSARALLGTIAGATISFAGIAFSVTLLVLQLASSQFAPRVVHTLFRDPFNKRVMGLVVGTFTYCVIVLRSVRGPLEEGGDPVIPNLSVAIAVVLGISAILAVVGFIDHNAHAMDVSEVLERVKREAVRSATRSWQESGGQRPVEPEVEVPPPDSGRCVRFERSGWVQLIDTQALLRAAPEGATVVLHTSAGRYAIEGSLLCRVVGHGSRDTAEADDDMRGAVVVGTTRTMQQDVGYGLRQLVDVALRALSPGVNDPTTAQDAIFHATAVLAELLRRTPPGTQQDEAGRALLVPEAPGHIDLVRLTFEEVRRAAADAPSVCIYLLEGLRLLIESTGDDLSPSARDEILRQADLVVAGCARAEPLPDDLAAVRSAHWSRFGRR